MKTFFKIFTGLVLVLLAAAAGGFAYLNMAFPKVGPADDIHIEQSPERLARGQYIVNHVTGCFGCHSDRDWNCFSGPIKEDSLGKGGFLLNKKLMGLPGDFYAKNITPYHLKDWTDGEIVRVLRTGVDKQGQALFPIMPYDSFSKLSQGDLYAIVAYLRTLKPIAYDPPGRRIDFPVNYIVKTIPQNAGPYPPEPDRKNLVEYGRYMVNATGCMHCHTPVDAHGQPLPGLEAAGGMEFHWPDGGTVRSVNISPDPATGIGDWNKDYFIKRFQLGEKMALTHAPVKPGEFNTPMPWQEYGGMTVEDLGAIYEYLHNAVKPVKHQVEKFTPSPTRTASAR